MGYLTRIEFTIRGLLVYSFWLDWLENQQVKLWYLLRLEHQLLLPLEYTQLPLHSDKLA